jgi:hypothetical protein
MARRLIAPRLDPMTWRAPRFPDTAQAGPDRGVLRVEAREAAFFGVDGFLEAVAFVAAALAGFVAVRARVVVVPFAADLDAGARLRVPLLVVP